MYSVIIPTLWKSNRTLSLLENLNKCEFVTDIVLIDNTSSNKSIAQNLTKINYINPGKNLYVNPSWNLGVILAKEDNLIICNDDINFNPDLYFGVLSQINLQEKGVIGNSTKNYELTAPTNPQIYPKPGFEWGWGCLMSTHKSNWVPIPNSLKVWFGDNFIEVINPNKAFSLRGIPVSTEMSTTSDLKEFDEIKNQDKENWKQVFGQTFSYASQFRT
tara:strand:+ start:1144 stop:1794 length:651 start_codon:yes stop_codon:yes gene_type:complete